MLHSRKSTQLFEVFGIIVVSMSVIIIIFLFIICIPLKTCTGRTEDSRRVGRNMCLRKASCFFLNLHAAYLLHNFFLIKCNIVFCNLWHRTQKS